MLVIVIVARQRIATLRANLAFPCRPPPLCHFACLRSPPRGLTSTPLPPLLLHRLDTRRGVHLPRREVAPVASPDCNRTAMTPPLATKPPSPPPPTATVQPPHLLPPSPSPPPPPLLLGSNRVERVKLRGEQNYWRERTGDE